MRGLMAATLVLVIGVLGGRAANAADDVVCGKILGFIATATADGSLVIPQPGDVAPAGTYILIRQGTAFAAPAGTPWVCVRTTTIAPTQVFGGNIATRAFVAFVAAGSPDFRAEPTPAQRSAVPGGVGSLPNTSTDGGVALTLAALGGLGVAAFARLLIPRSGGRRA